MSDASPTSPRRAVGPDQGQPLRVLYSFPHKIGADRICHTAWSQVDGLTTAGVRVEAHVGVLHRPLPPSVVVRPTLAWRGLRLSYKLLGTKRACALHDFIVARRLLLLRGRIDAIHAWPMGALRTLETARRLGIPTFLERPNAHTRFAYAVVKDECERLEIAMPAGHEHAFKPDWLEIEEREYELTDYLLCPSDFVAKTFRERGFPPKKLLRHQYGFDEKVFHPPAARVPGRPFTMLFAGGCAPRKGLHYALEAWLASPASRSGRFLVAGGFIPGYRKRLEPGISHPSVEVLGHRHDIPELMRQSDLFVLPTIEEGSALVTSEARGSGCVLLVSDAAGAICTHEHDALVHTARDVATLTRQLNELFHNPALLMRFRANSLASVHDLTWEAAGRRLLAAYKDCLIKPNIL